MIQRSILSRIRALRPSPILSIPRFAAPIPPRIRHAPATAHLSSRSYSSTPKEQSEAAPSEPENASSDAAQASTQDGAPASQPEAEDPLRKELEEKKREATDFKDRYLRSVADFRNLQDRTKRDVAAARDFAISKFARDLVDSVDNLDRALGTVPASALGSTSTEPPAAEPASASSSDSAPTSNESSLEPSEQSASTATAPNKDLLNLYDGLRMTERVLLQTLAKHGLERFDPAEKGEMFDPNLHDASFMAPMKGMQDGSVFNTVQKGFRLNGRVVRAAKVGVVKNT